MANGRYPTARIPAIRLRWRNMIHVDEPSIDVVFARSLPSRP